MKKFITLFLVSTICLSVSAQEFLGQSPSIPIEKTKNVASVDFISPDVKITGTENTVEYGEMVHLVANINAGQLPEHLTKIRYRWTVFEDGKLKTNVIFWPDGTQIFFAAGIKPKKFTVILNVECLYEIRSALKAVDPLGKTIEGVKIYAGDKPITEAITSVEVGSVSPIIREILVGGETPPPTPPNPPVPPGPNPPTPPKPDPGPSIPLGIQKDVYDMVKKNVPVDAQTYSAKIGNSYNETASRISASLAKMNAGVQLTAEDQKLDANSIMTDVKNRNAAALGTASNSWQAWNKEYGDMVYNMYVQGKLQKPENWQTLFEDTAKGLNYIK